MNEENRTVSVSVIILNYKRQEALEQCLQSVLSQDYTDREIIVVDNHSEEDLPALVRHPSIRLIELPANLGSCGGRNAGIQAACGDILVTLDNDVAFASPSELTQVVQAFAERPDVHVLAFQICDAGSGKLRVREWCHPRDWRTFGASEFETCFFGEGASAFRREVFDTVGLYFEPLFIGHEGHDLGLRLLEHGFRMLYCPRVRVYHRMSPETRHPQRPFYFYTRNYIWIACKDYGVLAGLRFLIPKLLMMGLFSLRSRCLFPFLRGLRDGWRARRPMRGCHTQVSSRTLAYIRALERNRPSLVTRFLKHRCETQI